MVQSKCLQVSTKELWNDETLNNTKLLKEIETNRGILYKNFSYKIKKTKKSVQLIEVFLGNEAIIGKVVGWKTIIFSKIDEWYKDKDERERGYRLFFAIKILNNMNNNSSTHDFLLSMKEISLEEVIFWVWQYSIYNDRAVKAFKTIHFKRN